MGATNQQELLQLVKAAQAAPLPEAITKAFTQPSSSTTGLNAYDLTGPAKTLYPVITPLRNVIPRVGGGVGTATNWRAITGINTAALRGGVSDGNRGGVLTTNIVNKVAAYKGLGFEDYATFEADMAAEGFDDVRARAVQGLLRSLMIYEEQVDLGGNASIALGTTPTPTTATNTTGGTIAAATYNVACIALTLQGFMGASSTGIVVGPVNRTNADASADAYGSGAAQKSATASQATTGSTSTISASVTPVRGAVAYAWFVGTAAAEKFHSVTTINSILMTALPDSGNQTLAAHPASDQSVNALDYDGIITQVNGGASATLTSLLSVGSTATVFTSTGTDGSGALVGRMATGTAGTGTVLTADGKGGIVEIDAMLKAFWDQFRLGPSIMWVSSQEALNITAKILTGNSNPAFRFNMGSDQAGIMGGMASVSYLNKFDPGGPRAMQIRIHPNMPAGTILFWSDDIPYPLSGVGTPIQKKMRRDYYQLEWPLRSRKYEYGVYCDGLLQCWFTPAFGLLTNIANG